MFAVSVIRMKMCDSVIPCPLCGASSIEVVLWQKGVCFANDDSPLDLEIGVCGECGFVFQKGAYSTQYDKISSISYEKFKKSATFSFPNRSFDVMDMLEFFYPKIQDKPVLNILEIGSNRGDLLYLIKEKRPDANILGVEPTKFNALQVPTLNAFFSADLFSSKFNVIILQHVLEHIKKPAAFMREVEAVLDDDGLVYVEVPCLDIFLEYFIEDFTLEHVSYFDLQSFEKTLVGLEIVDYTKTSHLKMLLRKGNKRLNTPAVSSETVIQKIHAFWEQKAYMLKQIISLSREKKVVFYGVSYYFTLIYKQLKEHIDPKNMYYFDDDFQAQNEPAFNVPRLSAFDSTCVVVICSPNYRVQAIIEEKLKKYIWCDYRQTVVSFNNKCLKLYVEEFP